MATDRKKAIAYSFNAHNDDGKDWRQFDTCCLDVSLFNRYQQDDYLLTTIMWINDRFENCIVNLGDTLHRYNLLHECGSIDAAHQESLRLGDEWIKKNEGLLELFNIDYKIIRNDDWRSREEFEGIHDALWNFYRDEQQFQSIIDNDVETFVLRQKHQDPSIVRNASLPYLLEELSADILLGQQQGVVHLYPGSRFSCYEYLANTKNDMPETLRGLENSSFKRFTPKKRIIDLEEKPSHTHRLLKAKSNRNKSLDV